MFKVKHTPKKHWVDSSSWGIVESMSDLFLQSIRKVVNFLFVNMDEVTTIGNASYIFFHIYVFQAWKGIPLLVCVEKVEVQGTTDNVF
jgi:hypothetical protein